MFVLDASAALGPLLGDGAPSLVRGLSDLVQQLLLEPPVTIDESAAEKSWTATFELALQLQLAV